MAAFVEFSLINLKSCNYLLALSAFRLPPSFCLTTIFISRIEKMSEQNGEIFTFP